MRSCWLAGKLRGKKIRNIARCEERVDESSSRDAGDWTKYIHGEFTVISPFPRICIATRGKYRIGPAPITKLRMPEALLFSCTLKLSISLVTKWNTCFPNSARDWRFFTQKRGSFYPPRRTKVTRGMDSKGEKTDLLTSGQTFLKVAQVNGGDFYSANVSANGEMPHGAFSQQPLNRDRTSWQVSFPFSLSKN